MLEFQILQVCCCWDIGVGKSAVLYAMQWSARLLNTLFIDQLAEIVWAIDNVIHQIYKIHISLSIIYAFATLTVCWLVSCHRCCCHFTLVKISSHYWVSLAFLSILLLLSHAFWTIYRALLSPSYDVNSIVNYDMWGLAVILPI